MRDSDPKPCPTCGATLEAEGMSGCPRCLMLAALQPSCPTEGAERPPPPSLAAVSAAFPQLEVLELVGQGGMGCVFKARQPQLNRFVALKILPEALSRDAAFAARFTREAQALAALSHPNIVTIHDFGQAGSAAAEVAAPRFFYLLMEFVDGVNLRQALRGGHFTPEQALAIVPPLCDALQFAHERGIVHRDIKPENLLLDKDGRIKVADFGIARMLAASGAAAGEPPGSAAPSASATGNPPLPSFLTADNATAGTPGYMAPEQQAAPQKVDSRADIYSLGVVLYEMLTGELPAEKLQPPSSRIRGMQIDVRLDEIVLRALEKTPGLRYQTAAELRTQVETLVTTPPPGSGHRAVVTGTRAPSPIFLKAGRSTLVTPAYLATARGQFFAYRTRGQLVLDDRQLTHTAPPAMAGAITVIPLAFIRDVSIGRYPRSMNPVGLDLLSVTYEEAGERKQVLLSPMEGYFAMPRTWNARAAEWATAIREAATAATGRAPTTTPSDQLGVPGSHIALLTGFLMPLVPLGVFLTCLTALTSPAVSRDHTGLISLFVFGMAAFGFLWRWTHRLRANSPPGPARTLAPRRAVLGVIVLITVFFGLAGVINTGLSRSTVGVSNLVCVPVGVSNNLVIVEVKGEVAPGGVEVQASLDGPKLSPAAEIALGEEMSWFAGTHVQPTPYVGNRPWRLWSVGRQTWRLGFALPDTALANEAFANLRSVGPLPAEPRRTFAATLFEVGPPGGARYRASLNVTPPVTSGDPNWVSIANFSRSNESGVTLTWELLASRPGAVRSVRGDSLGLAQLERNPKSAGPPIRSVSKLYGTTIQVELTRIATRRVLRVTHIGDATTREELAADFRELSDELLRARNQSFKTVRGAEIELCQLQGTPLTVQVEEPSSSVTTPATAKGFGWRLTFVGIVGLFIVLGVIALLVRLARRGGTAGKVVALAIAVPFLLLLLVLAVAALSGWRKVAGDFGPGVGLVRLSQAGELVLESSHPVPAQQHPPGQVQQTQNGFRVTLPAARLASFEFSIRQADDTWQPVPSLTALVATGEGGSYRDSLGWTLRRGNDANVTNQLWFWTVTANEAGGHPQPQLVDHGTHFTHHVPHGETLDWWQLAVPARVAMAPGTRQTLTLFRTFGTATARGGQPKEARVVIRCEPLPAGLPVPAAQPLVQTGLAAHALLRQALPDVQPKSEARKAVPDPKPAPRLAVPEAAAPVGTPTEPAAAAKAVADSQQPNRAVRKVGVSTATLALPLMDRSAEITQYRGEVFRLPRLLPPSHNVRELGFNVRFDPPDHS